MLMSESLHQAYHGNGPYVTHVIITPIYAVIINEKATVHQ